MRDVTTLLEMEGSVLDMERGEMTCIQKVLWGYGMKRFKNILYLEVD